MTHSDSLFSLLSIHSLQPFGTYEYNDLDIALKNSYRMVKEGGMDAVKLEGGSEHRARTIRHIVDGGGEFIDRSIDRSIYQE